ncbi:MAG TPA: peptidylprolyl isomerase [Polyangia bacterium]|nr:peptidylprolyl isomerase [Polyangia bacterium]
MQIADKSAVTIHYSVKNDAGEVLDTSRGRDPLVYLHGTGSIVPGLEKALAGKSAGDKIDAKLAPEEGYGLRDEKNVRKLPLRKLSGEGRIGPGSPCRVQVSGGFQLGRVVALQGDYATVDLNHPLAGMALAFEVEVVAVREATAEELAHGHVHGPGDHH